MTTTATNTTIYSHIKSGDYSPSSPVIHRCRGIFDFGTGRQKPLQFITSFGPITYYDENDGHEQGKNDAHPQKNNCPN